MSDVIIKELEKIQQEIKVLQSHIEIWGIEKSSLILESIKLCRINYYWHFVVVIWELTKIGTGL